MRTFVVAGCAALLFAAAAPSATAAPILCNTGQTAGCAGLAPFVYGTPDPNYTLVADPQSDAPAAAWVVVGNPSGGYPLAPGGPWVADDSTSQWIGPAGANTESDDLVGIYDYRTTFDLSGFDPATARISGMWATDDSGVIFINGNPTANVSSGFTSLTPFSIASGFQPGINVIDFSISNSGGGPTGLRVDDIAISARATPVPEPGTLLLLASGLGAAIRARRRVV